MTRPSRIFASLVWLVMLAAVDATAIAQAPAGRGRGFGGLILHSMQDRRQAQRA